jgi:hypothetical protein
MFIEDADWFASTSIPCEVWRFIFKGRRLFRRGNLALLPYVVAKPLLGRIAMALHDLDDPSMVTSMVTRASKPVARYADYSASWTCLLDCL